MFTIHIPPAPPVPVRIPLKRSILSPGWTHAITTIMGHPLSSESGKSIQEWILYHAIRDPIDVWISWDPTDPYDIKLLQEYVGSNGSVVFLPSSTIKSLISPWNYGGIILISRPTFMDISISSKTTPHSSFHHLHTHTHT